MSAIRTFNAEAELPTLEEARRLVIDEIRLVKREGVNVLKAIHGYGSSGKGGALCVGLRKSFGLRKTERAIRDFISGGDFSIFNDTVLALLEAVPELRGDPDLGATNEERLHGANGLLLTPTADHLFDRGFISFEDNGDVLISPVADVVSLRRMGLDPQNPPRPLPLNTDQKHFLSHHRKEIFLAAV